MNAPRLVLALLAVGLLAGAGLAGAAAVGVDPVSLIDPGAADGKPRSAALVSFTSASTVPTTSARTAR